MSTNLFYTQFKSNKKKSVISDYQGKTNFDKGSKALFLDTKLSCIFYVSGHKIVNFNSKTLTKFNDSK